MATTLNFPDQVPVLADPTVSLRAMSSADLPAWFKRLQDPVSRQLAGDPAPESMTQVAQWLEAHHKSFAEQTAIRWAIVPQAAHGAASASASTDISVGSIGLGRIDAAERSAELGCVVARDYWRRGIATAAARLVLDYAFEHLGLNSVRADLLQTNVGSRTVVERLGFVQIDTIENYRPDEPGNQSGFLYELRAPARA